MAHREQLTKYITQANAAHAGKTSFYTQKTWDANEKLIKKYEAKKEERLKRGRKLSNSQTMVLAAGLESKEMHNACRVTIQGIFSEPQFQELARFVNEDLEEQLEAVQCPSAESVHLIKVRLDPTQNPWGHLDRGTMEAAWNLIEQKVRDKLGLGGPETVIERVALPHHVRAHDMLGGPVHLAGAGQHRSEMLPNITSASSTRNQDREWKNASHAERRDKLTALLAVLMAHREQLTKYITQANAAHAGKTSFYTQKTWDANEKLIKKYEAKKEERLKRGRKLSNSQTMVLAAGLESKEMHNACRVTIQGIFSEPQFQELARFVNEDLEEQLEAVQCPSAESVHLIKVRLDPTQNPWGHLDRGTMEAAWNLIEQKVRDKLGAVRHMHDS